MTRAIVTAEALTWLGTPYHKNGRVKGAGVDCGSFLFCVYRECGLVPPEEEGIFSDPSLVPIGQDWWCNTTEEKYMLRILRHAYRVAEGVALRSSQALPGNLVLTRALGSRLYNHGGIVIAWPRVIHALDPRVEMCDVSTHCLWEHQEMAIFDPWEKLRARGARA